MTITTNPLNALLAIRNGLTAARWNFPDAVGSSPDAPAGIGHAVGLTYSFLTAVPPYASANGDGVGFRTFSTEQKLATREVLASIEAMARVDFTEVTGVGQLTFGNSSQSAGQGGYALYPDYGYTYSDTAILSTTESELGGDVWINRFGNWSSGAWVAGGSGYATLVHEVGHALGLKHPFEGNWRLDAAHDNTNYTVMSYTDAPRSAIVTVSGTETSYSWQTAHLEPSTLMVLDVAALQYLYGANKASHTGADVYRWDAGAEFFQTLWDAGGIDTIDAGNHVFRSRIDLHDGAYSSIGLRVTDAELHRGLDLPSWFDEALPADVYDGSNNLGIARGAIIENAIGGSGRDIIDGNDVANRLEGGANRDTLRGAAGNDTLVGGPGADAMTGGLGNDTFYVDHTGDTVVESTGQGTDTVCSSLASLTLAANVEIGRIQGAGTAGLTGNGLANTIFAGAGANVLAGGAGTDTLSYDTATARVVVSLGSTSAQATAGSGTDTISGFERLAGSRYGDRLTGSGGNNVLDGGSGNDTLSGRGGADRVVGGAGRDQLIGGNGADTFDFNAVAETGTSSTTRDVILDFIRGQDRIDLSTIDAHTGAAGNNAFTFIGSAAFGSDAAGQLRYAYDPGAGTGILYGSVDADRSAEFTIELVAVTTLSAADFVA